MKGSCLYYIVNELGEKKQITVNVCCVLLTLKALKG